MDSNLCAFITFFHLSPFNGQGYSRTRDLESEELLEQLPALQQLLHRLVGCQVLFLVLFNVNFFPCSVSDLFP